MTFLIAVAMLGLIIFVHELGHFLTAKFFKMPVSEFSIGMGPQVFSLDTKETTYSFRAIPIGGWKKGAKLRMVLILNLHIKDL